MRTSQSLISSLISVFALLALANSAAAQPVPVDQLYPVDGPDDAKVTIVVFSDFQCPFCSRVVPTLSKIRREFADDVRLLWVNYPLSFHRRAIPAARAAMAAFKQGAFWQMHDTLFANQKQLGRQSYERWARQINLDTKRFVRDLGSAALGDKIARDVHVAKQLGMRGTPGFLINGQRFSGAEKIAKFRRVIQAELAGWDAGLAAGIDRDDLHAHRVRVNNPAIAEYYASWLIRGEEPPKADLKPRPSTPRAVPKSNYRVPIGGDDGVLGAKQPLVTIVAFTDYQCPFCVRADRTVRKLLATHASDVQLRIKHFPLVFHKDAKHSAAAAVCAHRQGKFEVMHDRLLKNRRRLKKPDVRRYARAIGLNMKKFNACWSRTHAVVTQHMAEGKRVGVRGTPAFFVNGQRINGAQKLETFQTVLNEQLALAKAALSTGKVKRRGLYAHLQQNAIIATKPALLGKQVHLFNTRNRPSIGNPHAKKAAVVVFSELACPFCLRLLPQLLEVVGKRPKRRIALLHYPLSSQCNPSLKSDMHAAACPAAVWLEAAHKQRKVAKFLAAVVAHGTFSTPSTDNRKRKAKNRIKLHLELVAVAKSAGMNLRKARRFTKKAQAKALVATDLAQGKLAKVRGTPTLFIHGRRYKGPRTVDALLRAIDKQP